MEESGRPSSNSSRLVPEPRLNSQIAHAILDALQTLDSNLSALDSNSELNFSSIVSNLESSVNKIKETLDSKVHQIFKLLERPLPIEMTGKHSELLTVIQKDVENLREKARDNKEITTEIAQFSRNSAALHNSSADFILSSLRQDNIMDRAKTESQLNELKNLLLEHHHSSEEKFNKLSTDIVAQQNLVKDEFKSIKDLYEKMISSNTCASKEEYKDKNLLEDKTQHVAKGKNGAPHLAHNKREEHSSPSYEEPKYNNPYLDSTPEPKKQRSPNELADLI
jgi:hypothetical protein